MFLVLLNGTKQKLPPKKQVFSRWKPLGALLWKFTTAEISFDLLYRGSDSEVGFHSPSFPSSFGGSKFVFMSLGSVTGKYQYGNDWFFCLVWWFEICIDIISWYAKEFGVQFGIDMQIPKVENMQSKWQNKQKECHQSKSNTTKLSLLKKRSARLITLFAGHGGIWFS